MIKKKLGIIGGGQLGMFICQAAKNFGIHTTVFSTTEKFSAKEFCDNFIIGKFSNEKKIKEFIESSNFFTVETENIPLSLLEKINEKKKIFPSSNVIKIAQNRLREKRFLNSIPGVETAKFFPINNFGDLSLRLREFKFKAIIKSCEFGYDGKNQFLVTKENLSNFETMNLKNFVIEEFLDFKKEISVIVSKAKENTITYPPVENLHRDSILKETKYPANLNNNLIKTSLAIANKIAEKIGLNGILAVEMFILKNNNVLVNEIAPRPHNSGHWTLDACKYSQYDNLILSIFESLVKEPSPQKSCKMVNLIGEDFNNFANLKKKYKCYDYFKDEIRPKRKMGHYIIF
tara:strand:- start:270 stop:1307 length:1038 start_codon:yes stop_codon:yes gene_type:complete